MTFKKKKTFSISKFSIENHLSSTIMQSSVLSSAFIFQYSYLIIISSLVILSRVTVTGHWSQKKERLQSPRGRRGL